VFALAYFIASLSSSSGISTVVFMLLVYHNLDSFSIINGIQVSGAQGKPSTAPIGRAIIT
jgi:hypothetical protein